MAGKEFTEGEILSLINEGLLEDEKLDDGEALINKIYGGPEGVGELAPANRVSAAELLTLVNRVMNDDDLVHSFARIMGIRSNEAIVSLINSHNPYTSDSMRDMTIFTGNPDFEKWADNKLNQVEMEVDGPYTMPKEWYFKGLPQQVNKALRIKYRYQAVDLGKTNRPPLKLPHWVTAYMLIGYEDGGE